MSRLIAVPRSIEAEMLITASQEPVQVIRVTHPRLHRLVARLKMRDRNGSTTFSCNGCGYTISVWSGDGYRTWQGEENRFKCEVCGHNMPPIESYACRVLAVFVVEGQENYPVDGQLEYWRTQPVHRGANRIAPTAARPAWRPYYISSWAGTPQSVQDLQTTLRIAAGRQGAAPNEEDDPDPF